MKYSLPSVRLTKLCVCICNTVCRYPTTECCWHIFQKWQVLLLKSAHTDVRHSLRAPSALEEVLGSQSTGVGRSWNVCQETEMFSFSVISKQYVISVSISSLILRLSGYFNCLRVFSHSFILDIWFYGSWSKNVVFKNDSLLVTK